MALDIIKFIKGILIKNETDTTKQLELAVSASATTNTKTTLQAAQTADVTVTLPDSTGTLLNTASSINPTQIAPGTVNSTEFGYLDGVTSPIQTQLNAVANAMTSLTGDVTATGPGAAAATLATVNSNVGTFGTASSVSTVTVNGKGLVTAASDTPISINPATQLSAVVPVANGGTGANNKTDGFDNLSPTSFVGDLISRSSSGNVRVPVGTDGQVLVADSSIAYGLKWSQISGVKNYISNGDAEASSAGWVTYANAAGPLPVDGTGGSANVTFARSTVAPLRGVGSFIFTKDAANRQGQGASYDFSIDTADKAKVLQITFDYFISSGTYADGDLTCYIYDVTNAQVIQPAGFTIVNSLSQMKQIATFQANSNSTSYRLIFHVASTSASAYTVQMDTIVVGPQNVTNGAAITDLVSYTPTITGFGTPTNVSFKSRRSGDILEIFGTFQAGTPTATTAQISVGYAGANANVTIDTSKLSSNGSIVGSYGMDTAGSFSGYIVSETSNSTTIKMGLASSSPSLGGFTYLNGNSIAATNGFLSVYFRVPIVGWSSNVQLSSDTDTRVVAARYKTAAGQAITNGSTDTIDFGTVVYDTHAAVTTGASWKYTVPVPGKYRVAFTVLAQAAAGTFQFNLRKNGSVYSELYRNLTSNQNLWSGNDTVDCNAGDTLDIQLNNGSGGTITLNTNGDECKVTIERISGPSVIAANESVNATYKSSASTSISNATVTDLIYATKIFDSHNAYNTSTGIYTAPISGKYTIIGCASLSYTASSLIATQFVEINKNSGAEEFVGSITNINSTNNVQTQPVGSTVSAIVSLNAGDTIKIQVYHSSGASRPLNGDARQAWFSIARIGN